MQGIGNRPTADIDAGYADQAPSTPSSQKWPPHFIELFVLPADQMIGAGMVAGWSMDNSLAYTQIGGSRHPKCSLYQSQLTLE